MRDLVKTVTFAVLHFSVGFAVAYALTGRVDIAAGIALVEPAVNTVVFYLHETVWRRYAHAQTGCSRWATRVARPASATSPN